MEVAEASSPQVQGAEMPVVRTAREVLANAVRRAIVKLATVLRRGKLW